MQYIWNNFTFPSFQTNIRVEQGSFLSSILLALYLASVLRTWEKRINNLSIPIFYYVRETERGMMAADSELTKQLSSHTLLKNSIKFK